MSIKVIHNGTDAVTAVVSGLANVYSAQTVASYADQAAATAVHGGWTGYSEALAKYNSDYGDRGWHMYERRVDEAAENFRQTILTPGDTQQLLYVFKPLELDKYNADNHSATITPLLYAEASALGQTVAQVAATWQVKVAAWLGLAAQLEGARIAAKEAIRAATDEAAAQTAVDTFIATVSTLEGLL